MRKCSLTLFAAIIGLTTSQIASAADLAREPRLRLQLTYHRRRWPIFGLAVTSAATPVGPGRVSTFPM
jgi:hypothetical protein